MAAPMKEAATAAAKAAYTAASATTTPFAPRRFFEVSQSLIRSYFLGHHYAALGRMHRILGNIGLIIECRDFRVPLSSWNPLLESSLMTLGGPSQSLASGGRGSSGSGSQGATGSRKRIIVYTKRDLGPGRGEDITADVIERELSAYHRREGRSAAVVFSPGRDPHGGVHKLLDAINAVAREQDSLTGLRGLVVGMPNAGKSTLLNRLRLCGLGKSKAAQTGSQPGVTRKLSTPVRIVRREADDGSYAGAGEGVFLLDTPGVFVPFVPDAESMLKLSLVGCVKDGIVSNVTLADYLLYHLNLHDPGLYARFCARPTNDVDEFLTGIALRTGKLLTDGQPFLQGAADWIVWKWRNGSLGKFVLDEVNERTLAEAKRASLDPPLSLSQARKREKELRKARAEAKHQASLVA